MKTEIINHQSGHMCVCILYIWIVMTLILVEWRYEFFR